MFWTALRETNAHGQQVGDLVTGWTTRPRAEAVLLPGRYVRLEPLSTAHAPALHAALCNPGDDELWTYRPTDPPADVPGMEALIEATLAAPDMETFALVPVGGSAQGIASYMRIEPTTGQVEIAGVLYATDAEWPAVKARTSAGSTRRTSTRPELS